MNKPIIHRGIGGEYSTVVLPNGIVETIWFGDDGSQQFVGRTSLPTAELIAQSHISVFEGK